MVLTKPFEKLSKDLRIAESNAKLSFTLKATRAKILSLIYWIFYSTDSLCLKITEKVSFNIASEASYIYILSGQKLIYSKGFISSFQFWHFSSIFVQLELTSLVTLFDCKLQVLKNSPKWIIFGIFNQLLSTQNVNVARFARNVE